MYRKTRSILFPFKRNIYNIAIGSTCPLYHHRVSSRRISFHPQSLVEVLFFFFFFAKWSVVDFRGPIEVQRVYFLRAARTGYLFPGATGSCTGRSCGTTVKHRRGTQDYERRSSEQRSIHRCRRYRGIRNLVGSPLKHRVQSTMY